MENNGLKRYKSHKIVQAAKIWAIGDAYDADGKTSLYLDEGKAVVYVDKEWIERHQPQVGGYFVQYEDGYKSWSPAEAFEKGNIPLPDEVASMAPHKQRVIDEQAELNTKVNALGAFINGPIFASLDDAEKWRLRRQYSHMVDYSCILGARIAAFHDQQPILSDTPAGLSFGEALDAMKDGHKVARAGWNGKGIWVALGEGSKGLPASSFWNPHSKAFAESNGGTAEVERYFITKTAQGTIQMGWAPSQADCLAGDWEVLP